MSSEEIADTIVGCGHKALQALHIRRQVHVDKNDLRSCIIMLGTDDRCSSWVNMMSCYETTNDDSITIGNGILGNDDEHANNISNPSHHHGRLLSFSILCVLA